MDGSEYGLAQDVVFPSYLDLYETMKQYQDDYKVTMSRSNSRLLNGDETNKELVYSEISYKCKKSGIYKPKGKGIRKANSTKTNCPALIEVRLSKNKDSLVITKICLKHNQTDMPPTGQTDELHADKFAGSEMKHVERTGTMDTSILPIDLLEVTHATNSVRDIPLTGQTDELHADKFSGSEIKHVERTGTMDTSILPIDLLEVTHATNSVRDIPLTGQTDELHAEECAGSEMKHVEKTETIDTSILPTDLLELTYATDNLSVEKNTQNPSKNSKPTLTITREVTNYPNSSGKAVKIPSLEDIVMPDTKSRGRPRGRALTAIGLPIKPIKKGPVSFGAQRPVTQAKMILQWVISDEEIIQNALTGEYLIQEGDLPSDPKDLPDSIVASEVELAVVAQYIGKAALRKLNKLVQKRRDARSSSCRTCQENLSQLSILCDSCLCWYDYHCVKLKRAPRTKEWFCPTCEQ